ncbi:hypothetical protein PanWU01x14_019640 [Parasponia andersonii]|uniref:RNase H type-1 domain-containing protein n=1 Tax=Parasponia andersonii TaxID=3476 RepID=A0A2P5DYJ1_PARAD|nr:hypothetical protein PanWU01x14_019640 [Parasponia andersonii]
MRHSSALRDKIGMLHDSNLLENLLTLQAAYGIEAIELFAWHAWLLRFYRNAWAHSKREIPVYVIAFQAQAKWNDFRLPNLHPWQSKQPRLKVGNKVGLGGVVRDHRGKVMVAFNHSHHLNCSADIVEAMTVRKGKQIARDNGLHPLIVESDASNVVSLIENRSHSMAEIGVITHEIQNIFCAW